MPPRDAEKGDYLELGNGDPIKEEEASSSESKRTSLVVWAIFVISTVSSGTTAPVTYSLKRVAPITLTGWRHQVTALVMLPSFIYEVYHLDSSERKRALLPRNLALHFLSALTVGGFLATYTWAIYNTSIPHSVFLAATTSIYTALYVKLTGGTLLPMELGGIFLTFLGMGVFAVESSGSSEKGDNATYAGDLVAVLAAILIAIYFTVGKILRSWMPLMVFLFPMVVVDMILLGIAGVILEGWNDSDTGIMSGPFGWLHKENLWPVVCLGVLSGFIGQGGYGYVIKYAGPLVMPTGLCIPPIVACLLSWVLGQTPVPGLWTWIGGLVTVTGSTVVSVASTLRKTQEEARGHDSLR